DRVTWSLRALAHATARLRWSPPSRGCREIWGGPPAGRRSESARGRISPAPPSAGRGGGIPPPLRLLDVALFDEGEEGGDGVQIGERGRVDEGLEGRAREH